MRAYVHVCSESQNLGISWLGLMFTGDLILLTDPVTVNVEEPHIVMWVQQPLFMWGLRLDNVSLLDRQQ